jgi:MFS family permease
VLYALDVIGLPAGLVGGITAFFGVGGLIGAAVTPRLVRRFGENRMLAYSVLLFPIDFVVAALASGPVWAKFLLMSASALISGMAVVFFAVCMGAVTLRETPAELMGRVNATLTFTIQGVLTFGGLTGGLLGSLLGLRPVLWIGAVGVLLTIPWIWLSPLRHFSPREA